MRIPRLTSRAVAAVLSAFSLAAGSAGVEAQVLAQAVPSQYDLELVAGRRETRPLILQNLGKESVNVRLSLADLRMSERGALDLLPAGTLKTTLARILVFEPQELTLGPGERGVVRLNMTLPADGPATRYGVILSRVTPAGTRDARGVPSMPAELGTTVFMTRAPRSSIRAELAALDARVDAEGRVALDVRVRNRSQRHASCVGEVKLSDSTGATVIAGPLADGVVLPRAARVFAWEDATRLAAGRYTLTVTIDAGEPELLVGQKEIVVGVSRSKRSESAAREAP